MSDVNVIAEFRNVDGWEGYCINSIGVIKSRRRWGHGGGLGDKWRILKPTLDSHGYFVVSLCNGNGIKKVAKVHRLVAEAFIGPCPDGMIVCHCNGIRTDNRVENLRYDSYQGNSDDCVKHGNSPKGTRCHLAKLTDEKVKDILTDYATGDFVLRELSEKHGVGISAIHRAVIRKTWRHVSVP